MAFTTRRQFSSRGSLITSRPPLPPHLTFPCTNENEVPESRPQLCSNSVLNANAKRHDGRGLLELRPIYMNTGCLDSSSGSAFLSLGGTNIICAIYGPRPSGRSTAQDRGQLNLEYKQMPFASSKKNQNTSDNKQNMRLLTQAVESIVLLDRYQKSIIDVQVTVLEDNGGSLCAALTCIGLALIDAEIEVRDVVAAVSVYAIRGEDSEAKYILDMDGQEIDKCQSIPGFTYIHIGMSVSTGGVFFLSAGGTFLSGDPLTKALNLCESTCVSLGTEIRDILHDAHKRKQIKQKQKYLADYSLFSPHTDPRSETANPE